MLYVYEYRKKGILCPFLVDQCQIHSFAKFDSQLSVFFIRFDPLNANSIIPAESHRKLLQMHIKPFNWVKLAFNACSSLILNWQCLLSLTELWKAFKSYIISAINAIVYVVKSHLNAVAVSQIHGNTKWIPKWWWLNVNKRNGMNYGARLSPFEEYINAVFIVNCDRIQFN